MNNHFFDLDPKAQIDLLTTAQEQLDIPNIILEKDIWICWLLNEIFALPLQMAFKGGTSLSKAFNLIHRFSEDVDITLDYRNFTTTLDLTNLNRSQLKKISNQLKLQLKSCVQNNILPILKKRINKLFPNKLFDITLSDDGEKLSFYYPTVLQAETGYLRDYVLIEFGVRNSTEPCEQHSISTMLSKITDPSLNLPTAKVNVLSPIRTFWEKATLMHVECHRKRLQENADRLSRHWYDLAMLANSWVGKEAFSHQHILQDVVAHKKAFFNASYANYDDCVANKFRLLPDEEDKARLIDDYNKMRDADMFFNSEPPQFEKILETLIQLEKLINQGTNNN